MGKNVIFAHPLKKALNNFGDKLVTVFWGVKKC